MNDYDVLILNSSGGKDSQTMLEHVVNLASSQGFPKDRMIVAHADLGRVEWAGTADLAERQAKFWGLRFEKISRPQGDLLTQVEQRGKWPDAANRYCTSDHKRAQVMKIVTRVGREIKASSGIGTQGRPLRVLNVMGLRAQESPARAKQPELKYEPNRSTKSRHVWTWLPILDWTEKQVWESIKRSGVPYHHAYDLGMPRLSCVFCIFAPKAALMLAGKHNPELLDEYVRVERKTGHTFTTRLKIADIKEALDNGEEVPDLHGNWNM